MSELKTIITAEFKAIETILNMIRLDYEMLKQDKNFKALYGLISEEPEHLLAAFKAHIEGCEMPENSYSLYCNNAQHHAIELYRKALMESLKTSD